ncbi:copper resistance D family protein [Qaidamihabitans albus]|uniref:copper resistance D family protein n=1 Tax=Qaidamihabitans albus TaxID=2795733 RepID=UPI0018F1E32D|nr:CopD family protein [Qaidamihabitans albus]
MNPAGAASRVRYVTVVGLVAAAVVGVLAGVALSATGPVAGVSDVGGAVSVGIPLARAVFHLAAVGAIGLALLPVLIGHEKPRRGDAVLARARLAAVAAALVWAAAAFVLLVLQTAEFRPTATIGLGDVRGYVAAVDAGKALLIVLALAVAFAGLGLLRVRLGERVPAEVLVGLGLFGLLPLPVTGHASDWELGELAMVSIELHVLSAAAWVGGLGAMTVLLIGNRTLLARALPRFSVLATVCLLLSAATGLFNGLGEVGLNPSTDFWTGLFGTAYGRLVLLKLLCLVLIAAIGGYTRWRLLPRIARHEHTALAGWATLELAVMGLAFGFAAVLSRAPVS